MIGGSDADSGSGSAVRNDVALVLIQTHIFYLAVCLSYVQTYSMRFPRVIECALLFYWFYVWCITAGHVTLHTFAFTIRAYHLSPLSIDRRFRSAIENTTRCGSTQPRRRFSISTTIWIKHFAARFCFNYVQLCFYSSFSFKGRNALTFYYTR